MRNTGILVLIVLTLGAAIITLELQNRSVSRHTCRSGRIVRDNQRLVISSLLSISRALADRQAAGLRPIPPPVLAALRQRLKTLPAIRC